MKNKFIKSTIILIIGGGITKLLAMVIKIALARSIGNDGIGIYMMILPTFNLFITLSIILVFHLLYSSPRCPTKVFSHCLTAEKGIIQLTIIFFAHKFEFFRNFASKIS